MSTDGYGFEKNVEDMLVAELKEILSTEGLSTVGKKLELVSRLKDHLNEQPLKRKAEDNENEESNKKQKTESEHEEIQEEEVEINNNEEEVEEVEYQEVGVQGEYQENQEYQQGNEDHEGDEEVEVEEVGAGRELYPEEKEEQEEKERKNEESQSQDGNDSKEPSASGQNKIPTLSDVNQPNRFVRQPTLRDQVKVAMDEKNFEELDKLTKILLSQNEQSKIKLVRLQRQNEDYVRNMQGQAAAFTREKFIFQQIARERDELRMRLASLGAGVPRPGPTGAPMARPPIKSATMPIPQPVRSMPPTGQRYGQMPPVPRPPTTGYSQSPMAPQQQSGYSRQPAYTSSYHQQPSQQYQNHQQTQSYPQSSYQQRKY